MTDTRISQLPEALSLLPTDELVLESGGEYRKISGDGLAESTVGGPAWETVVKQADESVAGSTTLQADDELFFSTDSGGIYEFELMLIYASPAGAGVPDIKVQVAIDGTTRGLVYWTYTTITEGAGHAPTGVGSAYTTPAGTASNDRTMFCAGHVIGNGSEVRVNWAQNTSDANATIVRAGSVLRDRKVS